MIALVLHTQQSQERYQAFDKENRLSVSDDFFDAEQSGYIVWLQPMGYYRFTVIDEAVLIDWYILNGTSFEQASRTLSRLAEEAIRLFHPQRLWIHDDGRYIHVLQANAFYAKGTLYQKKVEPWRLQLSDDVFDPEGYIINQGKMRSVPFGWFNTMDKGCGWIAAYNLLKMCGREQTMQETAQQMGRYVLLGGVAGQELYTLLLYLRQKGIRCRLSLSLDGSALSCMHASRYGILLYSHAHGAHYTAYRQKENDRFQFYNAVYGAVDHEETAEDFLQHRELLPFASVIYVK